jgi:spore coat protein JB
MDTNRDMLLREVMAADFTLIDMNLYLDTHPCDQNALMQYNCALQRAKMLRNNFECMYGPLSPMSPYAATNKWQWIASPWPWERQ